MFFAYLSNNNLDTKLQDLLVHASLKNYHYLQLILNDLVKSKDTLKAVDAYQKMLSKLVKTPALQKLLKLEAKDVSDLNALINEISLLNDLSKMEYVIGDKKVNALGELIQLLKPFATKSHFNWAGRSINLLLKYT